MGSRLNEIFILVILLVLVLSFAAIVSSVTVSSPSGQFNITPDVLHLNWTNSPTPFAGNITVLLNNSFPQIGFAVLNGSSMLNENYSQQNSVSNCQNASLPLIVENSSGAYSPNATLTTAQNSTNMTIIFNTANCKPGRYSTVLFTLANQTLQNESANISVVLDLPINNTDQTTGIGQFNGQFPVNYTTYQSYYFNTGLVPNATSVTVNMSGWSTNDVDAFLFDNSSTPLFEARSANKTSSTENLFYQYLPKNAFWEIRVFGNGTSTVPYSGNIQYSTLNITNPASPSSQITLLNYGIQNTNATNNTNITIGNSGNITSSNVQQTIELYQVQSFASSGTKNFTLLVPDSTVFNRLKVLLDWNGSSNYSFNLYNTSGNLVASAINQYVQANISGAPMEIYNETTSIPSSAGSWVIQVQNNTNATDNFNLTAQLYVSNVSAWLATNYSSFNFNTSGLTNSSTDIGINLTVPTSSAADGNYQGHIYYLNGNNAGINLPLSMNVSTPELSVNNTMNVWTYRIDEDIGANLNRSFNFVINNTGSNNMTISYIASPGNLNFTYNATNGTLIPAQSGTVMNVNVSFNTNTTGQYVGAIFINATNNTVALSSHPYQTFNLTLDLNMTSLVNVNIFDVRNRTSPNSMYSSNTNLMNSSSSDNATIGLSVSWLNGTNITDPNVNFQTSVYFTEGNVSITIPSSGSITPSNGSIPFYGSLIGNGYYLNVTPSGGWNFQGGQYFATVSLTYLRNDGQTFSGTGHSSIPLIINNQGLYMSTNASGTGCSFGSSCNGGSASTLSADSTLIYANLIKINVTNYGPLTASSPSLTPSYNCSSGWSITQGSINGCPGGTFAPSGYTSSCIVDFTVDIPNATDSCSVSFVGDSSNSWYNRHGINMTLVSSSSTSSSSNSSSGNTGPSTTNPTQNVSLTFSKADSIIYVQQEQTNTSAVQVKNTGATVQIVSLGITTLNSSWYSVNNTKSASLSSGAVIGYLVTFSPGNADWNDYSGNFVETGSASSATSPFTLRVLPNAQTISNITSTFTQLNANFTELTNELNQSKNEGKNVTDAQQQLDLLKAKLDQANTYMSNGDYHSAYQLVGDIQNMYSQTKDALLNATAPPSPLGGLGNILNAGGGYLKYILIGAGVAVAGVLVYLFWPTKTKTNVYSGEVSKTVLAPKQTGNPKTGKLQFLNKIKEFFSKLFKRQPKESYQGKI